MMYRLYVGILVFIVSMMMSIKVSTASGSLDTLIVYEREIGVLNEDNNIKNIENILSNFSLNIETLSLDKYSDEYINKFDYVFIVNMHNDIKNHKIIDDLNNYDKNVYWIGDSIENLIENSNYNMKYITKSNNINKVIYKNQSIWLKDYILFNILEIQNNKEIKILATMEDGYNEYPFIIQDNNLYYISNYSSELSYIFEDTLNKFYNISYVNNANIKRELDSVVIEDKKEKENIETKMEEINKFIVRFILIVLVLFSIIFISFKIINKNKFIRR